MEVEDWSDHVHDVLLQFPPFWKKILKSTQDDEALREELFREIRKNINGEIRRREEDVLIRFFFKTFEEDHMDELLSFAEEREKAAIIPGGGQQWVYLECSVPLLLKNGMGLRTILRKFAGSDLRTSAELCLKRATNTNDLEFKYCVLQRFKKEIIGRTTGPDYEGILAACQELVPDSYTEYFSFLKTDPGNTAAYETWRERFPEELWPFLYWMWYPVLPDTESFQEYRERRKRFAVMTGDPDMIVRAYIDGIVGCPKLEYADEVVPILRPRHPYHLLELLRELYTKRANWCRGRSEYAALADRIADLKEIEGGDIAAPIIVRQILKSRGDSAVFVEELKKRFPDLCGLQ